MTQAPTPETSTTADGATSRSIVVTGASSGFGAMMVRALALAGHRVHAGVRETGGRNAPAVAALEEFAAEHGVSLGAVEMDVADQASVDAAVDAVVEAEGRLDVVVHNAGHMTLGPAEAFTPEQLAQVYDVNVLSTQRVNRAALPHLRARGEGLLVWIGSTSTNGGTPPFLAPYFAAKAAEDSLAVSYAAEVIRFGIDTTIVVPGAFTTGTNHFAHAGHPVDTAVAQAYDEVYPGVGEMVGARLAELTPSWADPEEVARVVVDVVAAPHGRRPFRVHVDPLGDGAEIVDRVAGHVRREFYRRIDMEELLPDSLR